MLKHKFVRDKLTSDNAAVWHQVIAGAYGNNGAKTTTRIALIAGTHGKWSSKKGAILRS